MTLVFIKLCTLNQNFVLWELVVKKTTMDFPLHKVRDSISKKKNTCVTLLKRGRNAWITERCSWSQKFELHVSFDRLPLPSRHNAPPAAHSPSPGWKSIHPHTVIWVLYMKQKISLQSLSSDCPHQNNKTTLEIPRCWNTTSIVLLNQFNDSPF